MLDATEPVATETHRQRSLLRRLLELDRPIPTHTPETLEAEVQRNYRWNFNVNLLDGASFVMGASFISSGTVLPLFVSKLTDSALAVGLVAVIAQAGWFLPQLFTARAIERLPRKKPVVVNLGLFLERLPLFVMSLSPWLALRSPTLALLLFLFAYAWHNLGAGAVATSWQELIARIFPTQRRGRFFGLSIFLGTGIGILGAGVSARILATLAFPQNFLVTFLLATLFIALSWIFLSLTREPVGPVTTAQQSNGEFWRALPALLKQDRNFRRFLITRLLVSLGGMGGGFLTVAALSRWQIADSTVGLYTGMTLAGQMIGNLIFGFLGDRYGHKRNLVISILASAASFALAWWSPFAEIYYAVFALQGVALSSMNVSGILLVMESAPQERRPTYLGLSNTAIGVVSALAPLLGAALTRIGDGYGATLFAASAAINALALLLMAVWVHEPRRQP